MTRRLLLLLAALSTALPAVAAEFTVTPVRIFMTPRDRAIAVTVTNDSAEEIVMQADLYSWKQKADGTDDLALTEDLVLSPPILKVPGKSRQVVRLARLTPPPQTDEQTYRLVIREVPEARAQAGNQLGVQLSLAFSLPVFITPPGAKRQLACDMARSGPETISVTCANNGKAYAQIRAIELLKPSGDRLASRETGGYILPGIRRTFDLKAPARVPGGPLKAQIGLDDGTVQAVDAVLSD